MKTDDRCGVAEDSQGTNVPPLAVDRTMVGGCHLDLGEWPAARQQLQRAAALGERGGSLSRLTSALLPFLDEDLEEATRRLEQHLEESQARGDAQFTEEDLRHLARVALWKGAYDEAERYARRCLESSPMYQEVQTLVPLPEALIRQGRAEEAAAVCDQAEQVATVTQGSGILADIHHVRGLVAAHAGDRQEAAGHLLAAVEILDRYPRPYLQARILEDLGQVYRAGGDAAERRKALDAFRRALDTYERLGAQKSAARVRAVIDEPRG